MIAKNTPPEPRHRWMRIIRLGVVFLPTLLATVYFAFVAADRYVSEAVFVVRSAAKPTGASGFGSLIEISGLGQTNEDVYAVQSFMTSRSAVEQLTARLPIRDIYARPEADLVARYPSVFFGKTVEELHQYLNWMISISYNATTGLTTLTVQAFRPEDAREVSLALLDLGEQTVNRMNARIQRDAMRSAEGEVKRGEDRIVAAQQAITRFRNAELVIDPTSSAVVVTEVIARLGAELAQVEAQTREVQAASSSSPQLVALRRRAEAIQAQIARERARVSSTSDGIADKLATYERLVLEREFAKAALSAAQRSQEVAQQEARRQQLYLERVVDPVAPDRDMAPRRLRLIASTFGVNVILAMVAWLIFTGLREHVTETE